MNKINNENFTCEQLREIHMSSTPGVELSREKFDDIIAAAEAERIKVRRRRKMLRAAIYCLLACAVCSGLLFGMRTWENATAGKDNETKIVQQGDNLIIGSGFVGGSETVGVTVEEYASIEDIPEDIREKAHFIEAEGFEVERIKVTRVKEFWEIVTCYKKDMEELTICEGLILNETIKETIMKDADTESKYNGLSFFEKNQRGINNYSVILEDTYIKIYLYSDEIKIETIFSGLQIG